MGHRSTPPVASPDVTSRSRRTRIAGALLGLTAVLGLAACASEPVEPNADPEQVDSVEMPELGACRTLSIDDLSLPSDATRTVDCDVVHNAQTYAVGKLPDALAEEDYDSGAVQTYAYTT